MGSYRSLEDRTGQSEPVGSVDWQVASDRDLRVAYLDGYLIGVTAGLFPASCGRYSNGYFPSRERLESRMEQVTTDESLSLEESRDRYEKLKRKMELKMRKFDGFLVGGNHAVIVYPLVMTGIAAGAMHTDVTVRTYAASGLFVWHAIAWADIICEVLKAYMPRNTPDRGVNP